MRLDLGLFDKLEQHRPFDLTGTFEPIVVGGETIDFDGPVRLVGSADRVHGGVRVTGEILAPVHLRCGRCLDRYPTKLQPALELFVRGPGGDAGEDSVAYAERLELDEAVVEALVVDLPVRPLCRPDCEGLCPQCGGRRENGCACEPEGDARWGVLAEWVRSHPEGDGRPR